MKIFYWIFGTIISLLGVIYITLFTSAGNSLIRPIIESQIQKQTKLESKLESFSLGLDTLDIRLILNSHNTVSIKGNYSMFTQSFDIKYSVDLERLSSLVSLTQIPLNGSFFTNGKVTGDLAYLEVNGNSSLAKSKTMYHVELTNFQPTSVIASIDTLKLDTLLYMLNQKKYAKADINLNVDFKNITPKHLDGKIVLKTLHGMMSRSVMKKDFNITLAKTKFTMNLDALLKGEDVDYKYKLNSNLAKVTSQGKIIPQPLALNIMYALSVKDLAKLKPITGADLRGGVSVKGTLKGNEKSMNAKGTSYIASSKTTFDVLLKKFVPTTIEAKVRHLKLQSALYMLKQPHLTDGEFDLDIDISDARAKSLKGNIKSKLTQGLLNSKLITRENKFKSMMPIVAYNIATATTLNPDVLDTTVDFNSNLVNLDIKSAKLYTKDTSFKSDYRVAVKDLDKLFFVTQRHLKGGVIVNGEVKKGKNLDLTMYSDIAGGKLKAKLHNDDFHADIVALETLDILDILTYPQVFKSSVDGVLDYNLLKQSGLFDGKLSNGKFTQNKVLDLTKKYAHTDLYKETFKGDVNAKIQKENILASVALKSNKSSIITKGTKLNSKTQKIDSKIAINANGNPINVGLKGNIASPKVSVDVKDLAINEGKKFLKKDGAKAAKKEIDKLLHKFF